MSNLDNNEPAVELRPFTSDDREFLLRVYAAAREIELSMVPWDMATKRAFVEHQFDAQLLHYSTEYPDASHDVVTLIATGEHVGRLYVNRTLEQISILDITILPEFRRRGIGSAIVAQLVEEARASRRSVQVYVETFNPSQEFFIARGFTIEGNNGMNLRLLWRRDAVNTP